MRKFVAVFGASRNLFPQVTGCSKVLSKLMAHKERLEFKVFESEIEAQKFIYPLKIQYLKMFGKVSQAEDGPSDQSRNDPDLKTQSVSKYEDVENNPSSQKEKTGKKQINTNQQISQSIAHLKKGSSATFEKILKIQGNQRYFNPSTPLCKVIRANQHYGLVGSYVLENGKIGIGYVVTTKQGKVVFQKSLSLGKNKPEIESSTLSLIYCLLDCASNNIRSFKVYSSCKQLSSIFENQVVSGDESLQNICRSVIRSFEQIELHIVKEDKNRTAMELAKKGAKMKYLGD